MLRLLLAISAAGFAAAAETDVWPEIVGPAQGEIPPPASGAVNWRTDFPAALGEAKSANRPLLVTWRCLPCKQCADFDKTVLGGTPQLTPLLQGFITVRMTDASMLDQRFFPYRGYQDLDLSWWAYFMSPEGRIYGIFGGKDHVSDATRISETALANSLRRVLAHHHDPRRESWNIDGPAPNLTAPVAGPRENPAFSRFTDSKPWFAKQTCLHCHQVGDLENFAAMEDGTFDLNAFTQPWPLPENVGVVLDRDDGLRVTKVLAGSAAETAGIRPGDSLAMAQERKLFGQADFRGVLHRAPLGDAEIVVGWLRGGAYHTAPLRLREGWRQAENWWRKTVYEGVYGPGFGFFPIKGPNHGKGRMSFRPFMGPPDKRTQNPWWPLGLRPNMEIVAVNGRNDDWNSRQLLAWFRLNHEPGDKVTLQVRQGGKTRDFTRTLPEKSR